MTPEAERFTVLGNLLVLRETRVEIALPRELGFSGDFAVGRQSCSDRILRNFFVENRQPWVLVFSIRLLNMYVRMTCFAGIRCRFIK